MSIIFIHGVANRDSDQKLQKTRLIRKHMFEELVVKPASQKVASFKFVAPYWGDLGVSVPGNFKSLPRATYRESLSGTNEDTNSGLDYLIALYPQHSNVNKGERQSLGTAASGTTDQVLVIPAQENPKELIWAFTSELIEDAFSLHTDPTAVVDAILKKAKSQCDSEEFLDSLRKCQSNKDVIEKLEGSYNAPPPVGGGGRQSLGPAKDKATQLIDSSKKVLEKIGHLAARGLSIPFVNIARDQATTTRRLIFVGDAIKYGTSARRDVIDRVLEAVKPEIGADNPLILVTHSFGGIIGYELLKELEKDSVALWVTVGSPLCFFIELGLFDDPLQCRKPESVKRWLNVYDPLDPISSMAEPIFPGQVTDILLKEGRFLNSAHGDYFVYPSFYEIITSELES